MSVIGSNVLAGASGQGGAGYEIERSLRFNSADSAYLSKNFGSAGNRRTWTWSGWVKRSSLGSRQQIFGAVTSGSVFGSLEFNSFDSLTFYESALGSSYIAFTTNRIFRDISAWYHIVVALDTTLSTDATRIKLYINGIQETSFSAGPNVAANGEGLTNSTTVHSIGSWLPAVGGLNLNAYLADVHFIDGQALAPTDFGEYDSNNVWQPKAYSGTYGTNGFYLDFSDNSSASALGTDSSGNNNDWTVNNLSVASGAGNDSLLDSPTNYDDGTNVGGNYATLNPLVPRDSSISYRQGNLEMTASVYYRSAVSTITLNSGKFYIEALCSQTGDNTYDFVGAITSPGTLSYPGSDGNDDGFGYYSANGGVYQNTVAQATYTTWTTGDIIGLAYDGATGKCWVSKNGTWQNSGDPAAGTGHVHTISSYATKDVYYCVATGTNGVMTANFGQRPFTYTPPTGFKSLCTQNLADITVTTSGSYTGNSNADGPFVYLNGVPTAMTIDGSAVTFGTNIDRLSNGFKIRSATTNNASGTSYSYSVTTAGDPFKTARAQTN